MRNKTIFIISLATSCLVVVVAIVALTTSAATLSVATEAESGALSGNAGYVDNSGASGGKAVGFGMPASGQTILQEDFSSYSPPGCMADGYAFSPWLSEYAGFGCTSIVAEGTNKMLKQSPQASTSLSETHASLVTGQPTSGPVTIKLSVKTTAQLRTPQPNPWEVGWVIWNYTREGSFYYFTPKTNGWELGKSDSTKADPSGPACSWPTYQNCKYAGAQHFLATGSSPQFPIGNWYTVTIAQDASNQITVTVNGQIITTFTDTQSPYTSGKVGLYNEDAAVLFDNVSITKL